MERAVLTDDGTTVNAHNLPVRIGLADDAHGLCIEIGLGIGGHQYGTIDDQIVGVGGRKPVCLPLAIGCWLLAIKNGTREG